MFTIDFTKPFLYKDIIYFNQGNLAANNILRCKLATGGDETLKGYIATVTFKTLSHAEINGSVDIVDDKNCIVDIKFPSNALEVGVNELEVILSKGEGADKVVTPSPIIKYEVWQCITTGNGIQGDSNYPILIDLISDVNNAVRIANNASATADVSLKQTAKMLEVVNANIAKANEAIDNTNSAKDEALNAVEEVNSAKDNLISEVNAAKNSMIEDVNSTKNTVVADVNQAKNDMKITVDEAIKFLKQEFNSLTAQQQEELEMLQARDGEVNLNSRLKRDLYIDGKSLKQEVLDLGGLKEVQDMAYSTDKGYLVCKETKNGTVKDMKIYGKSLLLNSENVEVLPGVEGVTIKSVGTDVDKIEVSSCSKIDYTYSNSYGSRNDYTLLNALLTGCNIINKSDKSIVAQVYSSNTQKWIRDDNVSPSENYIIKEGEYCPIITLYTSRGWQLKEEKLERFIFISTQNQDKKLVLFKDVDGTWKPISELRGLDTVCDTIELHDDGKYYYHVRTKVLILQGTDNMFMVDDTQPSTTMFAINGLFKPLEVKQLVGISDKYNFANIYSTDEKGMYVIEGNGNIVIRDSKMTLEEMKAKLQANPVKFIVGLAEEKVFEVNPLFLEAFEGETMASVNSGVVNAPIEFKMSSYISNLVLLNQKRIKELENEIYKSQDIQDMMILENDLRLMDIEFALMESMPIKLNLRSDNMFKGVTEFEFLKGRILSGNHTDEYLEKCINKYKKAGRLTEEEYDTLYDMIYPPVYDILAEK